MTKRSGASVWILEDDAGSRFVYEDILGLRYRLRMFERLSALEAAFASNSEELPALLVADIRLPDESFLRFLESSTAGALIQRIPFLVVSSVDDIDILRLCFSRGARDYITKPFGKNEFLVKIERLVGHSGSQESASAPVLIAEANELCFMDPVGMAVVNSQGSRVTLTSKEYQILTVLKAGAESGVGRDDLTARVWEGIAVNAKTLDIHIVNLRRKLASIELVIEFRPPSRYALVKRRPPSDAWAQFEGDRDQAVDL